MEEGLDGKDVQTTIMDTSQDFGCKGEPDVEEGGRKVVLLKDLQRLHCIKIETIEDDLELGDIACDGVEASPKLFILHLDAIVTLTSHEGASDQLQQFDELCVIETGGDVEQEGFSQFAGRNQVSLGEVCFLSLRIGVLLDPRLEDRLHDVHGGGDMSGRHLSTSIGDNVVKGGVHVIEVIRTIWGVLEHPIHCLKHGPHLCSDGFAGEGDGVKEFKGFFKEISRIGVKDVEDHGETDGFQLSHDFG